MRIQGILAFVVLWASVCVTADEPAGDERPTLTERIDGIFAAYGEGQRPGFAIGIVRNGALIVGRGYGVADLASGRRIDAETTFNVASLSKQLTAAAIARELTDGTMALEDRLSKHWPELPEFAASIRIDHLLYMTSGLPEYYSLPSPKGGWSSSDRFTVADAIGTVLGSGRLEYSPGTRWTYSNVNYQILAETVARKRDTSFGQAMRRRIFEPAGMATARVDAPLSPRPTDARAYVRGPGGPTDWHVAQRQSPHYGGSGVFASLKDLAAWDRALYEQQPFGKGFTRLMLSTRRFDHDKQNDALGLVHGSYRELPTIWYEGGDEGVSSYMVRLPSRGETVICLANFADGRCYEKARMVIDALLAFE